jgi:hypothetical protein
MRTWRAWLVGGFAAASVARLPAAQPDALAARQILGNAGIEAAFVARCETPAAPDQPAQQSFSTVFVFEGLVWNYSAEGGTTILGSSPPAGENLPAALRPLLARIAPPGAALTIYPQSVAVDNTELAQRQLRNACVIGCVATLTRVLLEKGAPDEAGFVLFLFGPSRAFDSRNVSPLDHSVLVYRKGGSWICVDPRQPGLAFALERIAIGADIDPMLAALAQRVDRPLQRSVYFPIAPATLTRLTDQIAARTTNRSPP